MFVQVNTELDRVCVFCITLDDSIGSNQEKIESVFFKIILNLCIPIQCIEYFPMHNNIIICYIMQPVNTE